MLGEEPGVRLVRAAERLPEDGAQPARNGRERRVRVVLHVDDPSVLEREDVRPAVAPAVPVCPGEGDEDAGAALLDGVEARVVVALCATPADQ